jgi:hypothetical protein
MFPLPAYFGSFSRRDTVATWCGFIDGRLSADECFVTLSH